MLGDIEEEDGVGSPEAMEQKANLDTMVDLAMQFWEAGAADERLGRRLAAAGCVVHIHFTIGDEDKGFTLMMDREPIEVIGGFVGDAEVEIFGSAADWLALIRQDKRMSMAIARGEMTYTGPVRKFLRIVPMLQNFDFDMWSGVQSADSG